MFDEELKNAKGGKKIVGEWLEHNVDMSIDGSLDKVWQGITAYARKSGASCVVLTDDEVFRKAAELWADPKTADIRLPEPVRTAEADLAKKKEKKVDKKDAEQITFDF